VKDDEGSTVTSRESRNWLQHTVFRSRCFPTGVPGIRHKEDRYWITDLRGIPSKEMIACLFRCEFANGWKDSKGIASQHNNVGWLAINHAGNFGIRNVFNRIGATSVLGNTEIIIIGEAR